MTLFPPLAVAYLAALHLSLHLHLFGDLNVKTEFWFLKKWWVDVFNLIIAAYEICTAQLFIVIVASPHLSLFLLFLFLISKAALFGF